MANDTPFGLAAYFFTRDLGRCWRVAEALEYGIVGVNEGITSTEIAPFGGMKESGIGREGSHHGIEEFLETKYTLMGGLVADPATRSCVRRGLRVRQRHSTATAGKAMSNDAFKAAAAERALEYVESGMRLGLGTGSTAAKFVDLLGKKVSGGLDVVCVATSQATQAQAEALGIRMSTLDEMPFLDLTIDGADEVDGDLRLIKGGGGALLREKIVATASGRMVVIADVSKKVETLGAFPLPLEVVPFGLTATRNMITALAADAGCEGEISVRTLSGGKPFLTDSGNLILECHFGAHRGAGGIGRGPEAHPRCRRERLVHRHCRSCRHRRRGRYYVDRRRGRRRADQHLVP